MAGRSRSCSLREGLSGQRYRCTERNAAKRFSTVLSPSTCQAGTGPGSPFNATAPRSLYSKRSPTSRRVVSATSTAFGGAICCRIWQRWAHEYPDTKLVRLAGTSIYVLHDLKTQQVDPGAGIDVIISGHSHVPKIDTVGGVLYLNPGSAGRRRFRLPITLATLEVTPAGIRPEIHHLGGD